MQDALAAAGQETWVDWKGIAPTAEWRAEIYKGVESANAFVAVLSPDYAASAVCKEEVEYAAHSGKKLIPICCRPVADGTVMDELAKLNYIFFRETDDFNAAVAKLIASLHTDLGWISTQTRLLVRAREWENEKRDGSFLLRGKDLSEAENWLAQSADKETKPTPLQTAYIVASRRSAVQRQRMLMSVVVAFLVVAVGLTIYAFIKRAQADTQMRRAISSGLGNAALLNKDVQFDLAALLSLEAIQIYGTYDARNAVVSVAETRPNQLFDLHVTTAARWITQIAFSPDGMRLLTVDEENTAQLWDTSTFQLLWSVKVGYEKRFTFSPDGAELALSGDGSVSIWQTSDHRIVAVLDDAPRGLLNVAFSPDKRLLAAQSIFGTQVWELATRRPMRRLPGDNRTEDPEGLAGEAAFDPTSAHSLAVAHDDGVVTIEDAMTGTVLRKLGAKTLAAPAMPKLAFSPDGKLLAQSGWNDRVEVWDVATKTRTAELSLDNHNPAYARLAGFNPGPENISAVAFSPDGSSLAAITTKAGMGIWDVKTLEERRGCVDYLGGDAHSIAFTPDGRELAVGVGHGDVIFVDPNRRSGAALAKSDPGQGKPVQHVAYSADSRWIASASEDAVQLWDVTKQRLDATVFAEKDIERARPVIDVAVSADSSLLGFVEWAPYTKDSMTVVPEIKVNLWDIGTHKMAAPLTDRFVTGENQLTAIAFSLDGTVASVSDAGVVRLWDPASGKLTGTFTAEGSLACVAFSPDGTLLVAAGDKSVGIKLWDVKARRLLATFAEPDADQIFHVGFSPDGKTLATAGTNGLTLWNVAKRQRIGVAMHFDQRTVWNIAFSPDGKEAAVRAGTEGLELWDVETQQMIGPPLQAETGNHQELSMGVAFSPDGSTIAAGGIGDAVLLWKNPLHDWANQACSMAARNLTMDEWRHYLGENIPYRRSCRDLPDGEGVHPPAK